MIDLIANGLALQKQKQAQRITSLNSNPQIIRGQSANDKHDACGTPAQSAYSAKGIDGLKERRVIDVSNWAADCAEHAENQFSTIHPPADLLREPCGVNDLDSEEDGSLDLSTLVQCNRCMYFTPDSIGDGVGIGKCAIGVKWTQQALGRTPLYRYSERHCVKYKINNGVQ